MAPPSNMVSDSLKYNLMIFVITCLYLPLPCKSWSNIYKKIFFYHEKNKFLIACAYNGQTAMIEKLIKYHGLDGLNLNNAAFWAIVQNQVESIKKLCELGWDINNNSGELIERALISCSVDMVEIFHKEGVDIFYNLSDKLSLLSQLGNMELMQYYIDNGVDIRKYEDIIINSALERDKYEFIDFIFNHLKIDYNTYARKFMFHACVYDRIGLVKHLQKNGIIIDGRFDMCIEFAWLHGNNHIHDYLLREKKMATGLTR